MLFFTSMILASFGGSSSSSKKKEEERQEPPLEAIRIDYKVTLNETPEEAELKKVIKAICDEGDFDIYFDLREKFDEEHMLPLTHVCPSHTKMIFRYDSYRSKFNLKNYHVENLETSYPAKKYFHSNQRKIWCNTLWIDEEDRGYPNIVELTHGIDEDSFWGGENQQNKVLSYSRAPLLVNTKWSKNFRANKYPKKWEVVTEHPNYDPKKETILYIGTYRVNESDMVSIISKEHNKDFEKVQQSLNKLNETYNIVLRHHPVDKTDFAKTLPNAIIQPNIPPIMAAEFAEVIMAEPSGATFAAMPIFYEKPWVYACNGDLYPKIKSNVVDESMAIIAHQNDDFLQKVTEAKAQVAAKKDEVKERRRAYYNKLQSSGNKFQVDENYADYWTVLSLIAGTGKAKQSLLEDAIEKYNAMTDIQIKDIDSLMPKGHQEL